MKIKKLLSEAPCLRCDNLFDRKREVQGYSICPECADSVARIKKLNNKRNWKLLGQAVGVVLGAVVLVVMAYVMTVLLFLL